MAQNTAVRWWLIRHRLRVVVHRIRFPGAPMFTETAAKELLGKRVIVGIHTRSTEGHLRDREQYDCQILRVNPTEGFVLQTHDGNILTLPPDLRPFFGARAGEYTFKTTGHVAVNPDLETTWTRTVSDVTED